MRSIPLVLLLFSCSCNSGENPSPCDDPCAEGESFCTVYGEAVECVGPDEEGCFEWGRPFACGSRQLCTEGSCTCVERCRFDEQACGPTRGMILCEGPDEHGCYFWGDETPCEPALCEELCGCEESCADGSSLCGPDGGVVTCLGADERNCSIWSDEVPCLPNQVCDEGRCRCVESECSAWSRECEGSTSSRVCAGPNDDGCYGWTEPSACTEGRHCSEDSGICTPDWPAECAEISNCEEEGRRYCGDAETYRECIRDESGCLVLDGDT